MVCCDIQMWWSELGSDLMDYFDGLVCRSVCRAGLRSEIEKKSEVLLVKWLH